MKKMEKKSLNPRQKKYIRPNQLNCRFNLKTFIKSKFEKYPKKKSKLIFIQQLIKVILSL